MNAILNIMSIMVYLGLCFLVWFLLAFSTIKRILTIRRTPTERIAALPAEGLVEIVGKAEGKEMTSPVFQTTCVLWQIEVAQRKTVDGETIWDTIFKKLSEEAFDVNDGTGRVQILPDPKSELIVYSDVTKSNESHDFTPQVQAVLENFGVETSDFGFNLILRVSETYIKPGEQIYVLGYINYNNGVKTIAKERGTAPTISAESEKRILGKYYYDVVFLAFFMILVIWFFWDIGIDSLSQFLSELPFAR